MTSPQFDFLILCGGAGSRLGGQDKPLLRYEGEPMVSRVAATVPAQTRTWLSVNRNAVTYRAWGSPFHDHEVDGMQAVNTPAHQGPLVGVLGGLDRCEHDWLLVSPGDTPCLSNTWYTPLVDAQPTTCAVIHDGVRQQNLHLLLARTLAPSLREYILSGGDKVWAWLAREGAVVAPTQNPEEFRNVNTQEDLET